MSSLLAHRRALFFVALATLASWSLLGACSSGSDCGYNFATRADDDADFESFQTFAVLQIDEGGLGGAGGAGAFPDDVRANLEVANDAAVEQLLLLGLEEVDPADEQPDLWIFSAAATERETGVYWYCVPGWYWWGWYYYWDPCAWMAPIEFEYTVGSLLVGVADASTDPPVPVFGGLVQGVLECDSDIEGRIESGVEAIFDDYPTNSSLY